MTLKEVNALYDASKVCEVVARLVEAPPDLKHFCLNLRDFEKSLGELKNDPYWESRLNKLRDFRFRACSTPLEFDTQDGIYAKHFEKLFKDLMYCDQIYPAYAEAANKLVQQAQLLTSRRERPILDTLMALSPSRRAGVLIKESRFIDELEGLFSRIPHLNHLQVVTASQLRNEMQFDNLYIVGPLRWFPDYIVTAPRAKRIHTIRYKFLGDGWKPRAVFVAPVTKAKSVKPSETHDASDHLSAEDLVPKIDWDKVSARIQVPHSDDQEFVQAQLFLLEHDKGVFLEKDSSELIVDPRSDEVLRRVKVSNLENGMFLILRDKGSGSYIVPLANKILGEHATVARKVQDHWKTMLRKAVVAKGMDRVISGMRCYGARSASEHNVHNWMSGSERKIRPRYFEDFQAIMRYLNLDDHCDSYWLEARRINKAHQMAGQEMKKILLAEAKRVDLNRLEQRGFMAIKPTGYETDLLVYRIVNIKPQLISVPMSHTGELLELGVGVVH